MNSLRFLSSPVTDALGWTLLHAVWQGFALVLPVAIVLHLMRNQTSGLRYRLGVITLLSQLLISAATFVWYYEPVVVRQATASTPIARYAMQIRWQTVSQNLPWHQQTQHFLEEHLSQFVLIYIIGVVLFGLRLAGGWVYLQHLSKTASPSATNDWDRLTGRLRSLLSIKAVIQVRESSRIVVPMVVGVIKPVLLLPIGLATSLSMREIEAVLAHELAHVKRHDYAVNLLQSVVEVLYFFHPALWWLSARVREEREHCCDDLAVQVSGGNGQVLAQALAHVEELRLSQMHRTPALAMAFASNKQHLLHRVRRVLGLQTRPFVSNGSLVGLTLATMLLMSLSSYAVQKQDKPKPSVSQPKPTRRFKIDKNSEYGTAANHKISYIIWKGKKLSTTRVAALQRQLDQVMAGQLSLDSIPQPDRDILLTIIEKNSAFDAGMDAFAEGMSHINYNNMTVTSLTNASSIPNETVEALTKVNYNGITENTVAAVDTNIFFSEGGFAKSGDQGYHQRQVDSLNQLMIQRSQQMQAIQFQMEKFRFPIEEIKRSQEVLNWRKDKLMEQRDALIEKHYQLLHNDGKSKLSQTEVEKQLAALEPEIKKLEGNMEEMNKQFEVINAKQEEVKAPFEKLERESEQLNRQVSRLADEISKYDHNIASLLPDASSINAIIGSRTHNLIRTPRAPRGYTIRPATAPAPPRPLRGLTIEPPSVPTRVEATVEVPLPAVAPMPSIKANPALTPKRKN